MKRIWTGLAAATGGLLAGLLIGLIETASLALLGNGQIDSSVPLWAMTAYGLLGLLSGAALGFLGSLLLSRWLTDNPNWWALFSGAIVLAGAGLIVVRFRLLRDLFREQVSLLSPTGLAIHAALALSAAGILVAAWWIGRRWSRSEPSPPSPAPGTGGSQVSRRTFLKASLASGIVALPAMAVASQLVERGRTKQSGTIVHRTGLPSDLKTKPNIILIVIDTLRADHVGVYGYAKNITANLDALAQDSIRFEHALTQSSWTKPSVATMLTSLYPSSHGAIYKTSALPEAAVTLPEVLSAHGYISAGFANNINVAPLFGFDKGFTEYEFLIPDYLLGASQASSQLAAYQTTRMVSERFIKSRKNVHSFYQPAEVVNERAVQWLTTHQEDRFFLFLHYMEPHDPYFEHPYNNYGIARVSTPHPGPAMAPEMVRLYDGEIAYVDRQIGQLLDWLKQQDLYDESMIVVTADHGEEFYEHGGWWHGLTLYNEQIHVPLWLKLPNQASAGAVDAEIARSLDIAPTLLRGAGLDVPAAMQGVDLLDQDARAQLSFAEEDHEGNILASISGPAWKLIRANPENPRGLAPLCLYHVAEDPGENLDLHQTETDHVAQLQAHLEKASSLARAQAVTGAQVELDPATVEQLRSLGY
jgi:arylsulfatase A-like enzyme